MPSKKVGGSMIPMSCNRGDLVCVKSTFQCMLILFIAYVEGTILFIYVVFGLVLTLRLCLGSTSFPHATKMILHFWSHYSFTSMKLFSTINIFTAKRYHSQSHFNYQVLLVQLSKTPNHLWH